MKKILAIILSVLMCVAFVACTPAENNAADDAKENDVVSTADEINDGAANNENENENEADNTEEPSADSDLQAIKDRGVLVVGITDFAPMDYKNADGEWIGFDADLAKAFAEYLGVEVQFQEIEWSNKVPELNSGSIDVVWNGMTLTDEVKSAMECSNAYCNNAQVVILPADVADNYPDAESMATLLFAVEDGSAGAAVADENNFNKVTVIDQATALLEVSTNNADAAIIDSLMAGAMVGEGTDYASLTYTIGLNSEEYGVGFRKGSDAAAALNAFFIECYEDGTMMELAETYGVQAAIIAQY